MMLAGNADLSSMVCSVRSYVFYNLFWLNSAGMGFNRLLVSLSLNTNAREIPARSVG
jgi:hypothetical protein